MPQRTAHLRAFGHMAGRHGGISPAMTEHEPKPDPGIEHAEEHDQDAEPTKNAPDEGRPDLTELSKENGESR